MKEKSRANVQSIPSQLSCAEWDQRVATLIALERREELMLLSSLLREVGTVLEQSDVFRSGRLQLEDVLYRFFETVEEYLEESDFWCIRAELLGLSFYGKELLAVTQGKMAEPSSKWKERVGSAFLKKSSALVVRDFFEEVDL